MSEQANSGFVTEGFESFPSLYQDNLRTGEFTEWSDQALMSRLCEYSRFLRREDLMPRARNVGQRIMNHLIFEVTQRDEL